MCWAGGCGLTREWAGRLREVESNCGEAYAAYKKALKKNWHQIDETRKEQAVLEDCWRKFKQYEVRPASAAGCYSSL